MKQHDVIIIGGGAAGFFAAINIAEQNPELKVAILERGKEGLQKVKISGGGRCNVTHAEFIPSELVRNYPRCEKDLLGPFHQFMTGDTIEWFEKRGILVKKFELLYSEEQWHSFLPNRVLSPLMSLKFNLLQQSFIKLR